MTDFSKTPITELAVIVARHLKQQGIDVVLVGGLAVEIYTGNIYLTKDIDMVNINYQKPARLHKAMAELGFYKQGRVYTNKSTDVTVEFPTGPLSVGDELITDSEIIQLEHGDIPVLCPADVVKDRLAAFIHWRDMQSLVQAVAVMVNHQLEASVFQRFCMQEGSEQHYRQLQSIYQSALKQEALDMAHLERLVARLLLEGL